MKDLMFRRPTWLLSSAIIILLSLTTVSSAATYYVDAVNGDDSYAGTSTATAWQTLAKVNSQTFSATDQILFKAGNVFVGQLYPKGSGSSGSPIIIDQYGVGAKPIISGNTDTSTDGAAVLLKNQQYWELRNLEITNAAGRLGVKIYSNLSGTTSYVRLYGLEVHNVNGTQASLTDRLYGGILFQNAYTGSGGKFDDVLISDCAIYNINVIGVQMTASATASRSTNTHITTSTVHDCGQDGIIWRQTDTAIIEYCTAYRTGLTQLTATVAIWLKLSNNSIIQYCEAYSNTDIGSDGQGFDLDIGCVSCILQYCYSHDNAGGFVLVCTDSSNNTGSIVRYNISQNDGDESIHLVGGVSGAKLYNNTIYAGSSTPLSYVVSIGNWNGYPSGTELKNNIIYQLTNANYLLTGATGTVFDSNCFYGNHPSFEPLDVHKIFGDPVFASPGTGGTGLNTTDGYKLTFSSPARNAGTTITGAGGIDYYGNSVPYGGKTDMGAHEYPSSDTTTPLDYSIATLMDESFDGYTTGTLPAGWTQSVSGRTTIVEDPSSTDKSLQVKNLSTDTATITANRPFSGVASGYLTIDYKVKPAQTTIATQVDIYGASAGSYQVAVCTFSAAGTISYKAGGSFFSTGVTYSANTWYDIRVVVDAAAKTYSLYVNNMTTPVATNVAFASTSAVDVGGIRLSVSHGAVTASAELDEVLVLHQI